MHDCPSRQHDPQHRLQSADSHQPPTVHPNMKTTQQCPPFFRATEQSKCPWEATKGCAKRNRRCKSVCAAGKRPRRRWNGGRETEPQRHDFVLRPQNKAAKSGCSLEAERRGDEKGKITNRDSKLEGKTNRNLQNPHRCSDSRGVLRKERYTNFDTERAHQPQRIGDPS